VGGGFEILTALHFGASEVTGVEVNAATLASQATAAIGPMAFYGPDGRAASRPRDRGRKVGDMMMLAAAILILGALPAPGAELPPDLAQAVKEFDQAQVHNDVRTLERLVADDYVLVNSNASVEDKRQYLADFNLPGFKIDPYVVEQPVQKVWGDAAVLGGLVHLSWTQDGQHQTRRLRLASVWAKRDGRWRATYTQVTRVPE
jgi:ketosteroid isomerase-like protein